MKRTILILCMLCAVPAVSQKARTPTPDEMRVTIKNLEATIEEQEERLRIHKQEIEALRKTVIALESRLATLEQGSAERRAATTEVAQH